MPTKQQLSILRTYLERTKNRLEKRLEDHDHFDLKRGHYHESMGELSSYDNHPADEGSALYEREKDVALNEHMEKEMKDINHALKAMDQGTYGTCETCGKEIPFERLQALPTATHCKEHSPDQVVSRQRPMEEGVLMPPYGKFEFDDKDAAVYDSEDAWQEVAKWGTSETPQDMEIPVGDYNDIYPESEDRIGYVEDYENFAGNDIEGKNITIYPNDQHEKFEEALDDEGIMTTFGDLKPYEIDSYTEEVLKRRKQKEEDQNNRKQ
ncbi:MAG: TraR/DksA C4-type zinc finger protein [Bacillaceae bacterium]|nr:TraR/DksA C4-type zinc finger protein [Bacillaceae bacterium]